MLSHLRGEIIGFVLNRVKIGIVLFGNEHRFVNLTLSKKDKPFHKY